MPRGSHLTPAFDRRLLAVIDAFAGALPNDQLGLCADYVRHGEEGLALDQLCAALGDRRVPVPNKALARQAEVMSLSDAHINCILSVPEPELDSD